MERVSLLSMHAELKELKKKVFDLEEEIDENREHIKQLEKNSK